MTELPQFLTPAEYAEQLRVSRITVYRDIQKGLIKMKRIGRQIRIPRQELEVDKGVTGAAVTFGGSTVR